MQILILRTIFLFKNQKKMNFFLIFLKSSVNLKVV